MSKFNKFFNKTITIADAAKLPWPDLVEAYRLRLLGWWFEPFADLPKTGHEAFPVLLSMAPVLSSLAGAVGELPGSPSAWDKLLIKMGMPSDIETVRLVRSSLNHLALVGQLPDNVGISGTGKLVVKVGDVLVIDPWLLRDSVRELVNTVCDSLADSGSDAADKFAMYIKEFFGFEPRR